MDVEGTIPHTDAFVAELWNVGVVPFTVHSECHLGSVRFVFSSNLHVRIVIQEDVVRVKCSLVI